VEVRGGWLWALEVRKDWAFELSKSANSIPFNLSLTVSRAYDGSKPTESYGTKGSTSFAKHPQSRLTAATAGLSRFDEALVPVRTLLCSGSRFAA
jgi:hypothetical protein